MQQAGFSIYNVIRCILKRKALIFSMKLRDRLLHLPRLVGRSNTAEGMGTLGLSHLHADNSWIKDYWDWAEEQHSVYTLTHTHTDIHKHTDAPTHWH